jgi:phosphatidylserine/phosphatidylglycerophosphate/cardiolipin synthase-like enzyme
MEFFEADEFILDLEQELNKGVKKLKIICFKLTYNNLFKKIYPSILQNLKDGAEVTIEVDAYFSRYSLSSNNLYWFSFGKAALKEKLASRELTTAFETLRSFGAKISFLNEPNWLNKNLLPFTGRDHRKVIFLETLNSKKLYFGATNLDDGKKNDYMIKIQDSSIYDQLFEINSLEYLKDRKGDITISINDNLSFLLDIGGNLKSNIQDTAFGMMKKAKNIIRYVNQLPPEPHILFAFILARLRGVKVEVVIPAFSEKQVSGFPFIFAFIFAKLVSKIFGFKILHCTLGFTHSKILVCDDGLLLGSHNLSFVGVLSGTREFSMMIKDSKLSLEVNNFIDKLINIENLYLPENYKLKPKLVEKGNKTR